MSLLRRFTRRDDAPAASSGPPLDPATPAAQAVRLIEAIVAVRGPYGGDPDLGTIREAKALLEADDEVRQAALLWIVHEQLSAHQLRTYSLLGALVRRRIVLDPDGLDALLGVIERRAAQQGDPWQLRYPMERTAPIIARSVEALDPARQPAMRERVARIVEVIEADNRYHSDPTAMKHLRSAMPAVSGLDLGPLTDRDEVGPALRAVFEQSDEDEGVLAPFAAHLLAALKASKPSKAWGETTTGLAASMRQPTSLVRDLLAAAIGAGDTPTRYDYGTWVHEGVVFAAEGNEVILRNVVWAASALRDADAVPQLRTLAEKTITVIGGQFGSPRSLKVALACPGAIAAIGAPGSLTALQGLQRSTRHGSLLREVNKAIDTLATSANVSRSELLETAVERHDLDEHGRRELPVGDWIARISVIGSGAVVTTWVDPSGAEKASLRPAVKEAEPAAAKAVATAAKAIKDTIAAERARLDGLFAENRTWPVPEWRERYLGHPITGALSRALIWRSGDVVGMPSDDGGALVEADGVRHPLADDGQVALWHPIEASDDEVRAWRERLMTERLVQPTKQAFRELYVVTPAELETNTYSNRFARHVIRQSQARALMKGRGWAPVMVAWYDDGIDVGVARRTLDAYGVRVEFFYDPIIDIPPTTSDLYPYCTTDQVRFFRAGSDDALAVADVPRLAFSELMRDVDLFVGVTSIGADPQWLDRGERRFDAYWNQWGFGELTQPARVRHEVIAKLLPALRIADRAMLTDRFLEVRGNIRSYKIHLGSGNILMSPSDTYLCIVAARHPSDNRLFLPFEDDSMLSLILSKAFLLADDTAITDGSILRQIRNG